jgi:CheY-like chemotaxis protein
MGHAASAQATAHAPRVSRRRGAYHRIFKLLAQELTSSAHVPRTQDEAQAGALLEESGQFEIVGEAGDGLKGIRRAVELQPDVIAMDIQMPNMDGLAATLRSSRRSVSRSSF